MLLNFDERTYCTPVMCGQLRVGRSREIQKNKDLGEFKKKFTNLNFFFVCCRFITLTEYSGMLGTFFDLIMAEATI